METESDTVELYIFGLKTVVSEPVLARANLNSTWYQFLNDVCRIQVRPQDAVMASTTSYSPVTKRGWCADLSEKIRDFVDKFSLKRDKYSVRLMMQLTPSSEQSPSTTPYENGEELSNSTSIERTTTSDKKGSSRRTRSSKSSNGTADMQNPLSHSIEVEDDNPMDVGLNGSVETEIIPLRMQEGESPCDDASESESPPTRARTRNPARQSGTKQEDLKFLIKSRVRKLGNPFLQKVQNEIKKLQRNQIWYRNVQYSPLASYLLREIFAAD